MIYILQILNIIITGAITFIFTKKLNEQSQKFNSRLEKFKFQNSNIQLNALKHIELITTSRIQWIQEVRENVAILLSKIDSLILEMRIIYHKNLFEENNYINFSEDLYNIIIKSDILCYIQKISLRLNNNDFETDKKLIQLLDELENNINNIFIKKQDVLNDDKTMNYDYVMNRFSKSTETLRTTQEKIKEISRKILKKEWDRVKKEIPDTINK